MLGNLGGSELIILAVIVLLVFGANRLPEAGRAVGKGIREFRRALNEAQEAIERPPADRPARRDPDPDPDPAAPPQRLVD
ncbi:MAG: Sec-independent protein translocase subunit TatA/TatB [Gemmatimonadales bacterium]